MGRGCVEVLTLKKGCASMSLRKATKESCVEPVAGAAMAHIATHDISSSTRILPGSLPSAHNLQPVTSKARS